ncbi:MAG: hypothetical protein ACFBSE_14430, partial [Prochloraceae cyanobacterium]
INSLKKMTTDVIRGLLQQLADAGMGIIEGIGSKMLYIPFLRGNNPSGGGSNPNGGNNPRNNQPPNSNGGIENSHIVDNNQNSELLVCHNSASSQSNNLISKTNVEANSKFKLVERIASPRVGDKLVAVPIDEQDTELEFQKTIGEIGDLKLSPGKPENSKKSPFSEVQINRNPGSIETINFTNKMTQSVAINTNTPIGDAHQSSYQPPIKIIVNTESEYIAQNLDFIEIKPENCQETLSDFPEESIAAPPPFVKPKDSTICKTLLNFYGALAYGEIRVADRFLPLVEPLQPAAAPSAENQSDRLPSAANPFEIETEELEDLEIELRVGMKVININSNAIATITNVNNKGGSVTVKLENGQIRTWYDYLVKPAPGTVTTYSRIMALIEAQIARLGWSLDVASDYLFSQFKVRYCHKLSDEQLFAYLAQLQAN